MIYLDSAAVVKMVRVEEYTHELVAWLGDRASSPIVSSTLIEVEVPRALRRAAPEALSGFPSVMARLYRLEIDVSVRAIAGGFTDPTLRPFDAIHLATAQLLAGSPDAGFEAFVTYDKRLLSAARSIGLQTASPGM